MRVKTVDIPGMCIDVACVRASAKRAVVDDDRRHCCCAGCCCCCRIGRLGFLTSFFFEAVMVVSLIESIREELGVDPQERTNERTSEPESRESERSMFVCV